MLSIIIPVYNGASYLERLFQTLPQTEATEYELVFVNDGSTDNSAELLKEYGASGKYNMKLCSISNSGVSAARNKGLELAEGDYIAFLDCDDRIPANYLAAFRAFTAPQSGTGTASEFTSPDFTSPDLVAFQSLRTANVPETGTESPLQATKTLTGVEMLFQMAKNPTRYGVYNFFYKKSLLEKHQMRFATGYAYYEDYDFLYRLLAVTDQVVYTETVLYYYLLQEGTAMATFKVERLQNIELLRADIPFIAVHAPEFLSEYRKHVLNRIYWSVMWQAALAFPVGKALQFGHKSHMRRRMFRLRNHPDRKVRISAKLYLQSPLAFVLAARLLGKSHSRVGKTDWKPFENYFRSNK